MREGAAGLHLGALSRLAALSAACRHDQGCQWRCGPWGGHLAGSAHPPPPRPARRLPIKPPAYAACPLPAGTCTVCGPRDYHLDCVTDFLVAPSQEHTNSILRKKLKVRWGGGAVPLGACFCWPGF